MEFLTSVVAFLSTLIFFFSSFTAWLPTRVIEPVKKDEIQLCLATISDTHIKTTLSRETMLTQGFKVLSDDDIDAVVVAGDLTDHGRLAEYEKFYNCVRNGLDGPQMLPVVGNHDTWADDHISIDPDNRAPRSLKYFVDCYNEYSGRSLELPYYTTEINGYSIICMAGMGDSTDAYIPDEEIEWLDAELAKATENGLPVFVYCHWPINGVNGQEKIWDEGGMGEQSDAVEAVLKKYSNVFFISGHEHAGFTGELTNALLGYQSIEQKDGVNYINMPCFMYLNTDAGNLACGVGYIIEVYGDSVLFRARNIVLQRWMPEYNKCIELV